LAPGLVWTSVENLIPTGIQSLGHKACSVPVLTTLYDVMKAQRI